MQSCSRRLPACRLDYIVSSAILMILASPSMKAVFASRLMAMGLSSAPLYHSRHRQFSSIFQTINLMIPVLPAGSLHSFRCQCRDIFLAVNLIVSFSLSGSLCLSHCQTPGCSSQLCFALCTPVFGSCASSSSSFFFCFFPLVSLAKHA